MIKKIFILVIFSIALKANAQWSYGVSASYAFALDDLANGAKNGMGAYLHASYAFDEFISAGINAGYITFANANTDSKISPLIDGTSLNIIPITASFKVYIASTEDKAADAKKKASKIRVFSGLDVGWATANLKLITESKNYGMFAPRLGVEYDFNDNFNANISGCDNIMVYNRLNSGSDVISFAGINIGCMFKF